MNVGAQNDLIETVLLSTQILCFNSRINKRAVGPWVAHLRMTDQWGGTICENMVECIMRNNSVKLY